MADVIKTKGVLQITTGFVDGSNGLLLIDDPKDSIAPESIESLSSFLADSQVILGDNGAAFNAITDARFVGSESTTLDIGQEG